MNTDDEKRINARIDSGLSLDVRDAEILRDEIVTIRALPESQVGHKLSELRRRVEAEILSLAGPCIAGCMKHETLSTSHMPRCPNATAQHLRQHLYATEK
jgi:hypothetical protein